MEHQTVSMISEISYDKIFVQRLEEWRAKNKAVYDNLCVPELTTQELPELIAYEKELTKRLTIAAQVRIQRMQFDPVPDVAQQFESKRASIAKQREMELQKIASTRSQALIEYENQRKKVTSHNASLTDFVESKHKMLLNYKDDLQRTFDTLDITPLDTNFSEDVTEEEFTAMIDEALVVCETYSQKEESRISKGIKRFQEMETDKALGLACIAIVIGYFAMPFVAVYAFYNMFKAAHNLGLDVDKLRMAYALMTEVDYKRFVKEEDVQELPEFNVDVYKSMEESVLEEFVYDDTEEREVLAQAQNDGSRYEQQLVQEQIDQQRAINELQNLLNTRLVEVSEMIKDKLSKIVRFPDVHNTSVVMSRKYTVGRVDGHIDVVASLPISNIIFSDVNRLRTFLCNALLSVRVRNFAVDIYDPLNQCADFTDFLIPETQDVIRIADDDLSKTLTEYRKMTQKNIKTCNDLSVDKFNVIAERDDRVPVTYRLLILVSNYEKLFTEDSTESKMFQEYFKYSAKTGCMIWALNSNSQPGVVYVDKYLGNEGAELQYNKELGRQTIKTFCDSLINYKDTGISYTEKFANKYIPRDKWFSWDTIKGIALHWGLENGDPDRGFPQMLGDANVHAVLGGATGAGKSAEINQMMMSLCTMYPPSELTIIYVDFKNVEAAKFVDKETNLSKIPHLKVISGTTDGEYALSIFEFLMNEMRSRQSVINQYGVTKMQELREQLLARYNTEHNCKVTWREMKQDTAWYEENIVPIGDYSRYLIMFDEFQVMYNRTFVQEKIVQAIDGQIEAITKLARAMSMHFFFTSQSMKGTISSDTLANFSLRAALRSASEVSNQIIGNAAASTILQKFGYLYTNDSAGESEAANKFWRAPFLDEKDLPMYIENICEEVEHAGEVHKQAQFYNEKTLEEDSVLQAWYDKHPGFINPNVFVLGERCVFSLNKAPVNTTLDINANENVLVGAFDRSDLLNLTMTIFDNLRLSKVQFLVNCRDNESSYLLDLESLVNPAFAPFVGSQVEPNEIVDSVLDIIRERVNSGEKDFEALYVVLMYWERSTLWANFNYEMRMKEMLREGPVVNVHFVFICKDRGEFPRWAATACNHRLCGMMPKDSFNFIDDTRVEKFPPPEKKAGVFALYQYGSDFKKIKIYQHTFTREIASREIVL